MINKLKDCLRLFKGLIQKLKRRKKKMVVSIKPTHRIPVAPSRREHWEYLNTDMKYNFLWSIICFKIQFAEDNFIKIKRTYSSIPIPKVLWFNDNLLITL